MQPLQLPQSWARNDLRTIERVRTIDRGGCNDRLPIETRARLAPGPRCLLGAPGPRCLPGRWLVPPAHREPQNDRRPPQTVRTIDRGGCNDRLPIETRATTPMEGMALPGFALSRGDEGKKNDRSLWPRSFLAGGNPTHKKTRGRSRLPESPSTGFYLCADGSGNHHDGLFGRCTPPGPVLLQLALPLNLPWHHRTPSTFLAAPTIRVALRSQNHAVFRRESFVSCVRLGSRFLPLPDPLHLSAEKASRSAASSGISCRPNR